MKPQHTPTPYSYTHNAGTQGDYVIYNESMITEDKPGAIAGYAATEANAALIVRAVNSHDALVEAAQLARDFMASIAGNDALTDNEQQVYDACTAALKLAGDA